MTVPPPDPGADSARRSRFVTTAIIIAVLLVIVLGIGLFESANGRRLLCPPSNPDCGALPPAPPPLPVPPPR
jgi:hypothetical protein